MPAVKLLLLRVDVRDNEPHDLLDMLNSDQMRRGLRLLQEQYQRNVAPSLILQQHLPEAKQQSLLPLQRPVILSSVGDEHMLDLL